MGAMTLAEAADWLGLHMETVRDMAAAGELPAARLGRDRRGTWRFLEEDLAEWLRSKYVRKESQTPSVEGACQSTSGAASGGSGSPPRPESGYASLLDLANGAKRKNSRRNSGRGFGASTSSGNGGGSHGKKLSSGGRARPPRSEPCTTT